MVKNNNGTLAVDLVLPSDLPELSQLLAQAQVD